MCSCVVQFHGDKPAQWIKAVMWEYTENYQDHRVKGLLLRAQQRHPDSQLIYSTFFLIELENKRKSSTELVLQHADVVYTNGKKKFTEIGFFFDMLQIADKFSFAKCIQQEILNDMRQMFPREALLWHTLAQRELNGLSGTEGTAALLDSVKQEAETSIATISLDDADNDSEVESYLVPDDDTILFTDITDPQPSTSTGIGLSRSRSNASDSIRLAKEPIPTAEFLEKRQQTLTRKRIEMCVHIYIAGVKVVSRQHKNTHT